MPTRYYFRTANATGTGLPTVKQSSDNPFSQTSSLPSAGSLSLMSPGNPPNEGNFVSTLSMPADFPTRYGVLQTWFIGPALPAINPLDVVSITLYLGRFGAPNSNDVRIRPYIYVWRPSGNVKVADIYDFADHGLTDNADNTPASTQIYRKSFAPTDISFAVQAGDRIVLELWYEFSSAGVGFVSFYYGGSDDTLANNTAIATAPASFIEFATDGLILLQDGSGTVAGAGTTSGTAAVSLESSGSGAGAGTTAGTAALDISASASATGEGTATGVAEKLMDAGGTATGVGTVTGEVEEFPPPVTGAFLMRGRRTTFPFDLIYWRGDAPDPLAVGAPLPLVNLTDIVIAWRSKIPGGGSGTLPTPPTPPAPSFPLMYPQPGPNFGEL